MLHNIYVFCLAVGVLYSGFSLIFHFFSAAVDFGFDVDVGFDLETNFDIFLPIKPFTVMVFLTVLGGAGLISEQYTNKFFAMLIAISSAYLVALTLYRFVYLSLIKAQSETKEASFAIGLEATILETIPQRGYGRISYVVDGNILSGVAARSNGETLSDSITLDNDNQEIIKIDHRYKKGEKVYILGFNENVYYVGAKQ